MKQDKQVLHTQGEDVRAKWVERLQIMKNSRANESDRMNDGEVYMLDQMISNTAEMIRDFSPIDLYKENKALKESNRELVKALESIAYSVNAAPTMEKLVDKLKDKAKQAIDNNPIK